MAPRSVRLWSHHATGTSACVPLAYLPCPGMRCRALTLYWSGSRVKRKSDHLTERYGAICAKMGKYGHFTPGTVTPTYTKLRYECITVKVYTGTRAPRAPSSARGARVRAYPYMRGISTDRDRHRHGRPLVLATGTASTDHAATVARRHVASLTHRDRCDRHAATMA